MPDEPNIPPAGIRLIREARNETRGELADHLGVTSTTIGNWERGDSDPQDNCRSALIDAIPSELSIDDVVNADDRLDDEPRAYDNEQRLFGSKWLQALREQPRIAAELDGGRGMAVFSGQQRMFVERLDLTGVEGDSQRDGERVTTVYYLHGDERRALRRFITENETTVRDQLQGAPNRISTEWDEWLYGLLEEEFRFWLYE